MESSSEMTTLERVGFIGLGGMGRGLVKNLVAKGVAVTAFDINPEAVASAKSQGAMAAESLRDIGDCRIIMICVNAAEDVEALLTGAPAQCRTSSSSTTPPAARKWSINSIGWFAQPAGATPRRR